MTPPCEQLALYVDGELDADQRDAFNAHLPDCAGCRAQIADALQLRALEVSARNGATFRRRRPRGIVYAALGVGLAAAAAAAVILLAARRPEPSLEIALAPTRPIEGRLSYAPADRHRPYDVARAGGAVTAEPIPLATLAALDRRGAIHALGAAYLLMGNPRQAEATLAKSGGTDVDADRALAALAAGKPEEAIVLLDGVLGANRTHPQALWNRALALRDLGLPLLAAEAFKAVAERGEPGWSDEARARAAALEAPVRDQGALYKRITVGDGPGLVGAPERITPADARRLPGTVRLFLYDAVRSATDAAAVRALLPLARELDAIAGTGDLVGYVERVAASDFTRRAPLAARYARLVAGTNLEAHAAAAFLADLRRARADDLLLGALIRTNGGSVPAPALPELRALAAASGDRWFVLLATEQEGHALIEAGEHVRADALLAPALAGCGGTGWDYRCARIALELGGSYLTVQRIGDARRVLQAGLVRARRGQEWRTENHLLRLVAELEALRDDTGGATLPLVSAYLGEVTRRESSFCEVTIWAAEITAMVLLNRLDEDGARAEMRTAAELRGSCPGLPHDDQELLVRSHLLVDGGTAAEVATLRREMADLRAAGTLSPGKRALLDEAEANLLLERDADASAALFARAIAAAPLDTSDVDAAKARGYAYASLVLAAGQRGDWQRALTLLAEETGTEAPRRCALGVAADDRRTVVVASGPAGALDGVYAESRTRPVLDAGALVPSKLYAALAGCESVDVLARAPIHGRADLLAPEIAWSFRSGRTVATGPLGRRLVITDTAPPAESGLARLGPWRSSETPDAVVSGAAATPSGVLAAMAGAGIIEIHAHGMVDLAVSDASFLALSPEADGRYALTAADLRRQPLAGRPVVILGACHAAATAAYQHQPWSLATAFIDAGARAVVASAAEIDDADAGPFFDALRARLARGDRAAIALHAERLEWLAAHPASGWVRGLMVFE